MRVSRRGGVYRFSDHAAGAVLGVFAFGAATVFLIAMLIAGATELYRALLAFDWPFIKQLIPSRDAEVRLTIRGLEMFILAPLPYLVLEGLAVYLYNRSSDKDDDAIDAAASLPKVKAIIASILVSAVAVDLVGKVLGDAPLDWKVAAILLSVIVVLTAYYVVMENTAWKVEAQTLQSMERGKGRETTQTEKAGLP